VKPVFPYLGALLMLLTSVGVNLDFHICQGKVKSFGIFAEAYDCDMALKEGKCSTRNSKQGWNKARCCSDLNLVYNSNEFEQNNDVLGHINTQLPEVIELPGLISQEEDHSAGLFIDYPPPDPANVDVYILLETYLI
jgi:hypothetical protein